MTSISRWGSVNYQIRSKLNEKNIEIIGTSKTRDSLKSYSTQYNGTCDQLFSFLLENRMNRYLFSLMLRKSPDIQSWVLNDALTTENSLESYTFKDSFNKKYICSNCRHLLKRVYAPELVNIQIDVIECPNCGSKKYAYPNDYRSDYRLLPVDLDLFSKKLQEIKVLNFNPYYQCAQCYLEFDDINILGNPEMCNECSGTISEKKKAEFVDSFLKLCQDEVGLWFEWFIYEISKHIYEHVEHGLILSYVNDTGDSCEKEVDVVALNNDKLILIECKDYLGSTPPDQFRTITKISSYFDETIVINFYKAHKDAKKITEGLPITILSGKQIDDVFLSDELIISHILNIDSRFGTRIFTRLTYGRKQSIIKKISSDIADENMIKVLIKLIENDNIESRLWADLTEHIDSIFLSKIESISNNQRDSDITDDLKLVSAYISKVDKDRLLDIINLTDILKSLKGLVDLSEDYDRIIRQIYDILFRNYTIIDFTWESDDESHFNNLYEDLEKSYYINYAWRARVRTLSYIGFIFEKLSNENVNKFLQLAENEFVDPSFHSGDVADRFFSIIMSNIDKFEDKNQIVILAKYLQENGINAFVSNSATWFLTRLESKDEA